MIPDAVRRTLRRADLRFTAWEMGEGPLVVLVHGFPDTPATWRLLVPHLAASGFRAVAVTCRGYEPDSQPADGDFGLAELIDDVVAWIDELGGGEPAHLIGHDWGSSLVQLAAARAPERVASLVLLAVGHPAAFAALLPHDFEQLSRSWYINFLQTPGAAEALAADGRLLAWLWGHWSPGWAPDPEALARMLAAFAQPGVLDAALAYYRRAFLPDHPRAAEAFRLLGAPIACPALAIGGADDTCVLARAFAAAFPEAIFTHGVEVLTLQNAGHFVHLEQPVEIGETVSQWIRLCSGS